MHQSENYIGRIISREINKYNEQNDIRPFEIDEAGQSFGALLNLYKISNEFLGNAHASVYSKILYDLLQAAILLRPSYSNEIKMEENDEQAVKKEREEWEGPVEVKLDVDTASNLFFYIKLIVSFMTDMENEASRIDYLVKRSKIMRLESRLKELE
jgi:hypothetical protein